MVQVVEAMRLSRHCGLDPQSCSKVERFRLEGRNDGKFSLYLTYGWRGSWMQKLSVYIGGGKIMTEKRIEDAFNEFLVGDTLENALDFAKFLKANEMIYDGEYEIHYKGKLACYIDVPNNQHRWWRVWAVGDYSNEYAGFPIDECTKEIAWANVVFCGNCDGVDCDPGKTEVIFGKEFTNVCNGVKNLAMRFTTPDAGALQCAKKMIEMRKHIVDNHAI